MGYIIHPTAALHLLQNSEKLGGHPCTRHIRLSNEKLMQSLYQGDGARNGGIQYVSTFNSDSDAAKAASQAFKNIEGSLYHAISKNKNGQVSFEDIQIDQVFKVRFAMGSGVHQFYCNHVSLVVVGSNSVPESKFFVKTFYPRPPNELRLASKKGNV